MASSFQVLFAMAPDDWRRMFGSVPVFDTRVLVLRDAPIIDFFDPTIADDLARTDILITGWGCPPVTDEALALMPRLAAIIHAAGSVKGHLTDAVWQRGIAVSSAREANAIPVAEFTVGAILLGGKRAFQLSKRLGEERQAIVSDALFPTMGNFGKQVGIVGASAIGRRVIELLRPFAFDVVVYDPFVDAETAERLGVRLVSLPELAQTSDVVSIHAPAIDATNNMIDAAFIDAMKADALLLNTARGSLIDHTALRRRLRTGELFAILDVTEPPVLPRGDELYELPNVVLTPHIAGSMGVELRRLADAAIREVNRLASGLPLEHAVARAGLALRA